jgi:hypothetical protein
MGVSAEKNFVMKQWIGDTFPAVCIAAKIQL